MINYESPQTYEIYLHRVGRTARAGRSGRSCTLAVEADRKLVKAAKKGADAGGSKAVSRTIPVDDAAAWAHRVSALEDEIEAVLKEEKHERSLTQAERDIRKGENLVEHRDEIMARPKRTWFESEAQKQAAKEAGFRELNGPDAATGTRPKTVKVSGISDKLSNKQKKRLDTARERKEAGQTGGGGVSKGKSRADRKAGGSRGAGTGAKVKNKAKAKGGKPKGRK